MTWDPNAACGAPIENVFVSSGILDPCFLISLLMGKFLHLNVWDTYILWINLRLIPLLIGIYSLVSLYTKNPYIQFFNTTSLFTILALSLYRDHVLFVTYWPLFLAFFISFWRLLFQDEVSLACLIGSIICFGISLQCYNPAYSFIFIAVLLICYLVTRHRLLPNPVGKISRIGLRRFLVSSSLLIFLLGPTLLMTVNYMKGEEFAFLRTYQGISGMRTGYKSLALEQDVDYLNVDFEKRPSRSLTEINRLLPPFAFNIQHMEGSMYVGLLGSLGIIFGVFYMRVPQFWTWLGAALIFALMMSPASASFTRWLSTILPFLKLFSQAHLLYPAFLISSAVAACIGMDQLFNKSDFIERIVDRKFAVRSAFTVGIISVAIVFLIFLCSGFKLGSIRPFISARSAFVFGGYVSITFFLAALLRAYITNRIGHNFFISLVLLTFLADLSFAFGFVTRDYHRNTSVFAQSDMLRNCPDLDYVPYRAPLLPMAFGTNVNSVVFLANARTALPSYWHCDVIFTSKRYYNLISSLSPKMLRGVLAIDQPIIRMMSHAREIEKHENALSVMMNFDAQEFKDTVVVEIPPLTNGKLAFPDDYSSNKFESKERAILEYQGNALHPSTLYFKLFDGLATVDETSFQERSLGLFHRRLFAGRINDELPRMPDGKPDFTRILIPSYPWGLGVNGKFCYFNDGWYDTGPKPDLKMLVISKKNEVFIEADQLKESDIPKQIFYVKNRFPRTEDLKVTHFSSNRVVIQTDRSEAGILLFSDLFDKNWTSTLDNSPTEVLICNYAFKGVRVPQGKHEIVFEYNVPGLFLVLSMYYGAILLGSVWCSVIFFRSK